MTAFVALVLTGRFGLAATFGLLDIVVKIGAYYAHERLWEHIHYGRVKANEYDIQSLNTGDNAWPQ